MAPAQGDRNWDSMGNHVATIDLTLSSPEPEQRPRIPPRQSQLPSYFKREPRPYSMKHIKNEQGQSAGPVWNATSQQQARRIHPRDLAQLVNTADSAALKNILIHLCQLSPALSVAVARGLTPHSTFAQELIKKHGNPTRDPAARRPGESDTNSVYERMKRRVAARKKVTLDDPRLPGWVREAMEPMIKEARSTPRDASRKPKSRQATPLAKRNYPPDPSGSESDKEHVHVPEPFPRSTQRAVNTRTPLRDIPRSSSVARPLSVSQRLAIITREPKKVPRVCAQCHEAFTEEDEVCVYHPGAKDEREKIWNCCNRAFDGVGCEFGGVHVDSELTGTVSADSGNKPESQTALCTQCYELTGDCTCSKYHPGRKVKREDGMAVYSCCHKPISNRGCEYNVDSERAYKRPSASPTPYTSHPKKSRIL